MLHVGWTLNWVRGAQGPATHAGTWGEHHVFGEEPSLLGDLFARSPRLHGHAASVPGVQAEELTPRCTHEVVAAVEAEVFQVAAQRLAKPVAACHGRPPPG